MGVQIDEGFHAGTKLDGLRMAAIMVWPGPVHEGKGQVVPIIDERGTPEQRDALLRIMGGMDTEPGATVFQVFSTTWEKVHDPVFTKIDFTVDIDRRRAKLNVPGVIEGRGEPIVNVSTGKEQRARINLPDGFEYTIAEMGRGWAKTSGAVQINLSDSYAHFANLHLTQSGVVR
jgi:hypothetical protein